jgi:flagellar biosynthesis/type III secretory pathway protein FliH
MNRSHLKDAAIRMYAAAPAEHRTLLLGALLNLSRRRYKDIDEIEQEILAQVRVTMDEIYEAIEEGPIGVKILEKGKAQGLKEGKAQGISTGERTAVIILWERRFGPLAADVTAALDAASEVQLRGIIEVLAGSPTEAEARAALGL